MNKPAGYPDVNDIIVSKDFACGYRKSSETRIITCDGKTDGKITVESFVGDDEEIAEAVQNGQADWKDNVLDLGAYDESRGRAMFQVLSASFHGGDPKGGHGPHDVHGPGWFVQAKRLTLDGKYDPKGEVIEFYMSGWFDTIPRDRVTIVGIMKAWATAR